MLGDKVRILVTRHGQTNWNLLKKIQGKSDIELNNTGVEQAKIIKNKLKEEQIDLIICSPLIRARQTADIINEEKQIPIIIDERISERFFGLLEGENSDSFDFNKYWDYEKNIVENNVESIQLLFKRVYSFLDDIKIKYKDKNILIVGHLGVSIPIKCYLTDAYPQNNLFKLGLDNCEIAIYNKKNNNKI